MIKQVIKDILSFLHIDITLNQKYDRQTKAIMQKVLQPSSNCIDVGCHEGEMLFLMNQLAPQGSHFSFEPIPYLYEQLKQKFKGKNIYNYPFALSDKAGTATFQWVKNAPAYSGLKKRSYAVSNPIIEQIEVEVQMLDEVIPPNTRIDLIKIDVEGGEFGVLKGAKRVITENNCIVIFECGKGASDHYGTTPENIYDFIYNELNLNISLMTCWLKGQGPLSKADFKTQFEHSLNYYFIAHPIK
jgi:FkbM family methyltransferase